MPHIKVLSCNRWRDTPAQRSNTMNFRRCGGCFHIKKLTPVLMEMGGNPGISHPFFIHPRWYILANCTFSIIWSSLSLLIGYRDSEVKQKRIQLRNMPIYNTLAICLLKKGVSWKANMDGSKAYRVVGENALIKERKTLKTRGNYPQKP